MNLRGYDTWKTREPDDDDRPVCKVCGKVVRRYQCDCTEWEQAEADERAEWEAWAREQPE